MTQQVFRLSCAIGMLAGLLLGSFGGYWLGLPAATSAPAIGQTTASAAVAQCTAASAVPRARPEHSVATVNAPAAQPTDLKLPDGLAWHPPKSLMPDFFVPDAKSFTADTYQQALQQLERADAELFEQLNQSLNGALAFDNQQNYQMLLRFGMPTVEELRYAYSKPVGELMKEQFKLLKSLDDRYGPQGPMQDSKAYHRLNALLKNRTADEMVAEYRQYNPNYRDGEPMPEQSDWPIALKDKRMELLLAYALHRSTDNMIGRIADFKLEPLIRAEPMPEQDKIVLLGMINPYNREFVSRYAAAHNLSETQRQLMLTVSNAAR